MFILLLILVLLFLKVSNKGSLAFYYALIVLVSLVGNLFIKVNYDVVLSDILHFLWILIVLAFMILPWNSYYGVREISCSNPKRLKTVTVTLIVFLMIQLIGCSILAYYTITMIDDINMFKYHDGTTDFYYSLGINLRPFMLATYFYPLSYIMIPLHLYYLSKGEKTLSFWCFVASLVSIVYGLTYFSRAHLIHYLLIYLGSYILLKDILSKKTTKHLKRVMIVAGSILVAYFVFISLSRFEEHDYTTRSGTYVSDNTVINSAFDYLVMWWNNSEVLFERFDWETLHGQIALQDINRLLSLAGIHVGTTGSDLMKMREIVLGEYSGSFIGAGEYLLYDFGPFVSIVILLLYQGVVSRLRPRNGSLTVTRLITISVLALLPTFAIFYSVLNIILFSFLFIIPINLYIKGK